MNAILLNQDFPNFLRLMTWLSDYLRYTQSPLLPHCTQEHHAYKQFLVWTCGALVATFKGMPEDHPHSLDARSRTMNFWAYQIILDDLG